METELKPTAFNISFLEKAVWPIVFSEDHDNPTKQEELENEVAYLDWEQRGGMALRTIHVTIVTGPQSSLMGRSLEGLRQKRYISPEFHCDKPYQREMALDKALQQVFESIREVLVGQ